MRNFAFSLVACVASVFVAQSFAQTRDLFAEFEAEATQQSADSVKTVPSSSSVAPAPVSSANLSSSAPAPSSSSVALSSSVVVSSSSVAPAVAPVADTSAVSSSSAPVAADSAVADSAKVDSAKVDSAKIKEYVDAVNASVEKSRKQDSLAALSSSSSEQALPSSSSMSRRDLLGPVKVSKVHSIDEMKGKYKSPRKALFMSLVVPGSGQLYVGGSKFTYARGVVYLALEAGLWAGWYYNSVYKYDKQVDKYKKFADEHYSIGRYENSMYDLFTSLDDADQDSRFVERYMSSREAFCEALYGSSNNRGCYTSKYLPYEKETDHKRYFGDNPRKLKKERKGGFYEPSEVYQMIGGATYVLGWDDVDSVALVGSLDLGDPNSETIALGQSSNRDKYRSMREEANDLADMQAWFIGGLILNHLVSAVDAALTAHSHNKSLYEEDVSWYDRLHFDSRFSFFNGYGVDVRASWGF
jgi:hypothetical protein